MSVSEYSNIIGGVLMEFIDNFKMLGDETRIRILNLLKNYELCVCEIETILEITQSNASRHLNRLKTSRIIESVKDSQWTYYKIHPKFKLEHKKLFEYFVEQVSNCEICCEDTAKLERYESSSFDRSYIRENKDEVVRALNIPCGCKK